MADLSETQLIFLWKKGFRLNDAWFEYGSTDKKAAWKQSLEKKTMIEVARVSKENSDKGLNVSESLELALKTATDVLRPRANAQDALRSDLIRWLRKGKVTGLGFGKPRTIEAVPFVIPREHWFGRIKWDQDSVERDELAFIAVKVIPTHWLDGVQRVLPNKPKSNPVGRPSLQQILKSAIGGLIEHGEVNVNNSMASHYDAICKRCVIIDPELGNKVPPVSPEAIRKAFSPIFKDLKKTKKL